MNYWALLDPRIYEVRPEGLRSYLLAHGWQLQPQRRPQVMVFNGPLSDDGEPFVAVVGCSERMSDFRARVMDTVCQLSDLEERPALDILADILREQVSDAAPTNGEVNGTSAVKTRKTPKPKSKPDRPNGRIRSTAVKTKKAAKKK